MVSPPPVLPVPPAIKDALRELAGRWADAQARERANYQLYASELCAALGVEGPRPAGSGYEFELPVKVINRDGKESTNFVDLYKRDHFVLEAKDREVGRSDEVMLRKAYGQARSYITHLHGDAPPYILVLDVGRTMLVWDRWQGGYGGFGAGKRIDLPRLHERPDDVKLLRDIWEFPKVRDPRERAQRVTKAIAEKLALLAASLEARGFGQERVSRFLMRCVFTMFAEDVRLLPEKSFLQLIEAAMSQPDEFPPGVEELWRAMNVGKRFGFRKLLRFNGHFFAEAEALPLTRADLGVLLEAATKDWSDVEPAIFGTLLTRALDEKERHRLGAEYTPPEFIARVIRPAVEEPIRERWTAVQAEVLQLLESGGTKGRKATANRKLAEQRLRDFHAWLRSLSFLDPACGSGNFLYVTMHAVKRIELEVINELSDVTGHRELRFQEVDPSQFHGIEVKPWAREIAELTLWIGFHQFWRRAHGEVQPEEPLLRDTGTLENRDAVLVWGKRVEVPERSTADRTPRIRHPVTGEMVPDPAARIPYFEYRSPRPAKWPRADFIVGNPPFLGKLKQREALGDGYVDALREAYPDLPDAADLVMYWWHKAAIEVAEGRTLRAGLITTKAITHATNRAIVAAAAERGARVAWAIADHYWNDGMDDARVRVAMTVIAREPAEATLVEVDGEATVVATRRGPRLNFDLSIHADVASTAAQPLLASRGISSLGFLLAGSGFQLEEAEARRLLTADPRHATMIHPLRSGKDVTDRPRSIWVIDFGILSEPEAKAFPMLYDIVRDRVKPERHGNNYAANWWQFARPREGWRALRKSLRRYLVTPETSKHRIFTFVDASVAASHSLVCVGLEDAYALGVLSSVFHATWALAAGSRLGVDATPRYNKSSCFEPFPFPDPPGVLREKIASVAEKIDAHREAALRRSEKVGMTIMYNVVDKLRSGAELSQGEREAHQVAACGTLRDLHDELDRLVADAYGWAWPEPPASILDRLVELHDRRFAEERAGKVRWLRPEYQRPRFTKEAQAVTEDAAALEVVQRPPAAPWPADAIGQITALRNLVLAGPITADEATTWFVNARREIVERHLETLAILGELLVLDGKQYAAATPAS